MMTTMNTGAASLSDEQKRAAITACALMIKGICLTTPNAEWTERIENRIHYLLRQIASTPQADADFKNFHRLLCERFDYVHDEGDWKRDQLSLIEHIASRAAIAAGGAQEAVKVGSETWNVLRLCITELSSWMHDHGQDLRSQEAIKRARALTAAQSASGDTK
jgi:hypothetical protein